MKVSVIIPVYNAESYIKGCIDTLCKQTLPNFEVLMVDDHSTDRTVACARAYAEQRGVLSRFRFLSTHVNSGPGVARNVGVLEAHGEYIAFMDCDDQIAPTMLQELTIEADKVSADICYCQLRYQGGARDGKIFRNPLLRSGAFGRDEKREFLVQFTTFCPTYLYRKHFLMDNALTFPSERSSEDTNFLTKVLLAAQRVAVVDKPLYIYCVREESLTTTKNPTRYRSKLAAMDYLMDEVRSRGWYVPFQAEMDYIYLKKGYMMAALNYIINAEQPDAAELRELTHHLCKVAPTWRSNAYRLRFTKVRLLSWMLSQHPAWALRLVPMLVRKLKIAV
jgi:glycosyltransferase involved in cell wall biosynthesis